LQTICFSLFS